MEVIVVVKTHLNIQMVVAFWDRLESIPNSEIPLEAST
jgi:hypothetical protein